MAEFADLFARLEREEGLPPNGALEEFKQHPAVKKALYDSIYQFFKTGFQRQFVSDFMDDGSLPMGIKLSKELDEVMTRQFIQNSTKSPYLMLTINIKPGVTLDELDKVVKKLIKKKSIKYWEYVYEVRAEEEKGVYTGLHCHMLLEYHDKPYSFKKGVKNTCKNICNVDVPSILNFKHVDMELVPDKHQYLLGEKQDAKLAGVNLTNEWRESIGIEAMYESNPPLPCRVTQTPLLIEEVDTEAPPK